MPVSQCLPATIGSKDCSKHGEDFWFIKKILMCISLYQQVGNESKFKYIINIIKLPAVSNECEKHNERH